MWAQVDNNSVIKVFPRPKAITIGDINHPANTMSVWPEAELNGIGIYEIVEDTTNFKDQEYYINTGVTHTYNSETGKVDAAWGTAIAKEIDDVKWTQAEIDNGDAPSGADTNTVKSEGLKKIHKNRIDELCNSLLAPSDWMAVKAFEESGDVESGWKTWRASIRTKCNSMQAQIDGAANVDALAALYEYTGDPATRPLGEFPIKE